MMDTTTRCRFFVAVATPGLAVTACAAVDGPPGTRRGLSAQSVSQSDEVREVVALIDQFPPWTETAYGESEFEHLLQIGRDIQRYDLDAVGHAIAVYLDPNVDSWEAFYRGSKVFLILRVIFEVPARSTTRPRVFGGWGMPPGQSAGLWPLVEEDGRLVSVSLFSGYLGERYDGFGEFNYFRTHYRLRDLSGQ